MLLLMRRVACHRSGTHLVPCQAGAGSVVPLVAQHHRDADENDARAADFTEDLVVLETVDNDKDDSDSAFDGSASSDSDGSESSGAGARAAKQKKNAEPKAGTSGAKKWSWAYSLGKGGENPNEELILLCKSALRHVYTGMPS